RTSVQGLGGDSEGEADLSHLLLAPGPEHRGPMQEFMKSHPSVVSTGWAMDSHKAGTVRSHPAREPPGDEAHEQQQQHRHEGLR
ncbi:mCG1036772, partial [Mus musculus]